MLSSRNRNSSKDAGGIKGDGELQVSAGADSLLLFQKVLHKQRKIDFRVRDSSLNALNRSQ